MRRTRQVRFAVTAMVAGALAAAMPTAGGAQTTSQAMRVGESRRFGESMDPVRGRDAPAMAVNPSDPRHIVLVDQDMLIGQCDFHTTFNGGRTWTDGHLTAPPGFTTPPCPTFDTGGYTHANQSVAFGSGQNVYTTFSSQLVPATPADGRLRQGDSILVARSTDGGRTFGAATVAIRGSADAHPYYVRPGLTVEPRPQGDRVYVSAWGLVVTTGGAGGGPGDRRAVTARSDDGGATWAPSVDAQAPGEQVRETTEPVVASDGTVYVGWRNRDPAPATNNISVGKSTDQGATWTQSRAGEVTGTGISNNGGFPRLAINRQSNTLYLVYQGLNDGDIDIFFQRSTDGAATWSAPKRLNDDRPGTKAPQLAPHLSVAPDGRVDVVWFDGRGAYRINGQDPVSRGFGDIYLASSADAGQTFTANRRISDRSLNNDTGLNAEVGSYIWYGPELAAIGNDELLVAWADPRNGSITTETQDIYLARVDMKPIGPAPVNRLDRLNPVDFSVILSQMAYPGGSEQVGRNDASRMVVVNEDDTAGALVGAVLARGFFGPLMVSPPDKLTKNLKDEVQRVRPRGVYVIGGEDLLAGQVLSDLSATGVPEADVIRISGPTPAHMAKAAAETMDFRTTKIREEGQVAAFDTAVIVNPENNDAAAAVALAAAARAPILFSGRDEVPTPTTEALASLKIGTTLVVGGPESVSDAVLARLPSAKRLGGADPEAVSLAVAKEMKERGLPSNIVYVTDASRPLDQAVLGAAVSRLGGLMLATRGASTERAIDKLAAFQSAAAVDRVVVALSGSPDGPNVVLIGMSVLLGVTGLVLLLLALRRRQKALEVTHDPQASSAQPSRP